VPVVPTVIHGSKDVRKWRKLRFPKVTVQFGEPMTFPLVENPTREQQLEAAETVFARVREMYEALEAKGRSAVIKSNSRPVATTRV
jgi:1-acyl-sn-glycerol-3-phosphate acyltransferase